MAGILSGVMGKMGSILDPIGNLLGLYGGKQESSSSAPAPVVPKPAVMPIADDEAAKAAKRRSLIEQMQRKGRQSTILTDGTDAADVLGG